MLSSSSVSTEQVQIWECGWLWTSPISLKNSAPSKPQAASERPLPCSTSSLASGRGLSQALGLLGCLWNLAEAFWFIYPEVWSLIHTMWCDVGNKREDWCSTTSPGPQASWMSPFCRQQWRHSSSVTGKQLPNLLSVLIIPLSDPPRPCRLLLGPRLHQAKANHH